MEIMEQSNISQNARKTDKQDYSEEELMTTKEVENTPFTVVGLIKDIDKKREYYLMLGKYRLTEALESEEEALEEAGRMDWNRIIQVMACVAMNVNNEKQ